MYNVQFTNRIWLMISYDIAISTTILKIIAMVPKFCQHLSDFNVDLSDFLVSCQIFTSICHIFMSTCQKIITITENSVSG